MPDELSALHYAPPFMKPNGLADWKLEHAVRRHVLETLLYCEGSWHWAAAELGVDAATLYRWRRKWGWTPSPEQEAKGAGKPTQLALGRAT